MTSVGDVNFLKTAILTETFYAQGDVVDESLVYNLEKLVRESNKDMVHGQLFVSNNINNKTAVICANLDIIDTGMPDLKTEHYRKLVEVLYYTTRGFVMTLNEQLEEDKKSIPLHEFAECIINAAVENTKGISNIVLRFDKNKIIQDVITGVDNLDGIMIVDWETVSEGRLNAFSFILDQKYWQNTCQAAIADVVKEMDAKALRIALQLSMKVL